MLSLILQFGWNFALFFLILLIHFANSELKQQSLDQISDALNSGKLQKCGHQTNGNKNEEEVKECETVRNAFHWLLDLKSRDKKEENGQIKKEIDQLFVEKYNLVGISKEKVKKRSFQNQLNGLQGVNLIGMKFGEDSKVAKKLEKFAKTLQQMDEQCLGTDLVVFTKAMMLLPKLKIADDVINDKSMEEGQNDAKNKRNKKRLIRLRKAISIFAKPSHRRSKRCSVCIFACCCFAEMNKIFEKCFPNN